MMLALQSCKIDKAAAPEKGEDAAEGDRPRAVFGERPKETPGQPAPKTPDQSTPKESQTASRPSETQAPARQAPPEPSITGQRKSAETENAESLEEQHSNLFLYYRRPGTRVGDPGELGASTRDPRPPPPAQSIAGLIYRWADTLLSGDLSAHMSLYAPSLERFGGRTNVSRDAVRREKEQFLATLSNVRRFEVHNVRVYEQANGQLATAEFRTNWNIDLPREVVQSARQRLTFRRSDGQWRIQSEEQLPAD